MTDPFVLDRTENPHPRMREHALQLRRAARVSDDAVVGAMWLGYRDAMIDATGCTAVEMEAWLDKHDDFDHEAIGHKDATAPPAVAERVALPHRLEVVVAISGPKDRP